jgi:hypothetical protein
MEGTTMMNHDPLPGTRCPSGCPAGECLHYEQDATTGPCPGSAADWCASEAEKAAGQLADALALAGIMPPGHGIKVHAHGYTAITYAILALRHEISEQGASTRKALAELDETAGIIAGAITDPDDRLLDEILDAAAGIPAMPQQPGPDPALGPTHTLTWLPRWEHGTAMWDIQPFRGWEHLDRPDPWPVPGLPGGRAATAAQVEEWAWGVLGWRVSAVRRRRLAVSIRRLRAWLQPEWDLWSEVPEGCDGTRAAVIATDAEGRYLLRPSARPGPLQVLAPPSCHAAGQPWEEAARGALSLAGATAPRLREDASGWRDDRCGLVPCRASGHNWMILTALDAAASHAGDGQWATRDELQRLADRTIGYAAGRIPAGDLDGRPGLAPEWIGWLAGSAIDPVGPGDIAHCARLARIGDVASPF